MASMGMHCAIVVWHSIINQLPYADDISINPAGPNSTYAEGAMEREKSLVPGRLKIDQYALIIFASVYIIAHIILVTVAYYIVSITYCNSNILCIHVFLYCTVLY